MTGNDCNQIGLQYSGFRNQGENKCIRPYDSCLGKIEVNGRLMSSSRITDYFNEDMESVSQSSVGRYFPQFLYPGSTPPRIGHSESRHQRSNSPEAAQSVKNATSS